MDRLLTQKGAGNGKPGAIRFHPITLLCVQERLEVNVIYALGIYALGTVFRGWEMMTILSLLPPPHTRQKQRRKTLKI